MVNTIQETKFAGSLLNSLDSVDYFWDKGELRKLFVLFNIIDCNHSNERFRFDLYNKARAGILSISILRHPMISNRRRIRRNG